MSDLQLMIASCVLAVMTADVAVAAFVLHARTRSDLAVVRRLPRWVAPADAVAVISALHDSGQARSTVTDGEQSTSQA
jgi:hypothetical protein